jgi:AraC family transcriptional regulator
MGTEFNYFHDIIPQDVYSRTKASICRYIAVFEPKEFTLGKVLYADDYHFILYLGNPPVTRINDVEYRVKKGDMLAVKPWDRVYGVPGNDEEYGKYLHIAVKREFFTEIAAEMAGKEAFEFKRVHGRFSSRLLDLIGELQLEIMNYGEAYPKMLQSLSTQIVFQAIRDLHTEQKKSRHKVGEDNPYINKAILLMQENYQTNISISDICNLIYLSPYHFKRIFKECTGRPPHRYLIDIRLEKAKELLINNKGTIEEIARLCGFVNSAHFAVAFKRRTGLSPSEYRKVYVQKKS